MPWRRSPGARGGHDADRPHSVAPLTANREAGVGGRSYT